MLPLDAIVIADGVVVEPTVPPSATVKAVEDSIVISLDRNLLIDKLEEDYEFASHFYKALAIFLSSRLRSTTSMLGYGKVVDKLEEKNYEDEVDPNVLENCGISPKDYSGFAFGMGIDRIALLLYQIDDIRLFSENDLRFLKQFKRELF